MARLPVGLVPLAFYDANTRPRLSAAKVRAFIVCNHYCLPLFLLISSLQVSAANPRRSLLFYPELASRDFKNSVKICPSPQLSVATVAFFPARVVPLGPLRDSVCTSSSSNLYAMTRGLASRLISTTRVVNAPLSTSLTELSVPH